MNNHGLDLEKELLDRKPEDWIFGASSPKCIAEIPNSVRFMFLPRGEVQRGAEDTMDCATRAPINLLEAKFNWLLTNKQLPKRQIDFLVDNEYISKNGIEFSDAFIAIKSGTTRTGNSLIAPINAIYKHGLIPKWVLPLHPNMTWDEYHNPNRITPNMEALGKRFLEYFSVNYERVVEDDMERVLETDMLDVAGYAWPEPKNGEYPKSKNQPNHAFLAFAKPKYFIFDNYPDTLDGDFIKKLSTDYDLLDFGYRVIISLVSQTENKGFWVWFRNLLKKVGIG